MKIDKRLAMIKEIRKAVEEFKNHKIRGYFTTLESLNIGLESDFIKVEEYLKLLKTNNIKLQKNIRKFRIRTLATILNRWKNYYQEKK